ncbi:hypothetical protein MNV49_003567 [Pseudohyphozyma bogoriensis]|nr:hypothetical protein MNV49_003567 [Pseudohyphozyma bogoriensis]
MPHLPPEILTLIFHELTLLVLASDHPWPSISINNTTFARLALVSKAWQRSAYDVLYGHLHVDWRKTTALKLLKSLKKNPQLQSPVKRVSVNFMDDAALRGMQFARFQDTTEYDELYDRCHDQVHDKLDGLCSKIYGPEYVSKCGKRCWDATFDLMVPTIDEVVHARLDESGDLEWAGKKEAAALLKFISSLTNLRHLELANLRPALPRTQISSPELAVIFAQLTSLSFRRAELGTVTTILNLTPHIKALKLSNITSSTSYPEQDLISATNLSQLGNLHLDEILPNVGAAILSHSHALVNLQIREDPSLAYRQLWVGAVKLPQLQNLIVFRGGSLANAILTSSTKLQSITSLHLRVKELNEPWLDSLYTFFQVNNQLTRIEVDAEGIPDQLVAALPTGLNTLRIVDGTKVQDNSGVVTRTNNLAMRTAHLSSLTKLSIHHRHAEDGNEEESRQLREEMQARGIEFELEFGVREE